MRVAGLAGDYDVTPLFSGIGSSILAVRELRLLTGRTQPGVWLIRHAHHRLGRRTAQSGPSGMTRARRPNAPRTS